MAFTTGYISSQDQFGVQTYSYYDLEKEQDVIKSLQKPEVLEPGDVRRSKFDNRRRAQTQPVKKSTVGGGYNSLIDQYANAMLSEVNAYYDEQERVQKATAPRAPGQFGKPSQFEAWQGDRRKEQLQTGLQRSKAVSGVRQSAINAGFQLQKEMMRARVRDGADASIGKIEKNYKEALQNVSREPYVVGKKNFWALGRGKSTAWHGKAWEKENQPLVIDAGLLAQSKPDANWKGVVDASLALVNAWEYDKTATNDDFITLSMNYERALLRWSQVREQTQRQTPPLEMPGFDDANKFLFEGAGGF